jgi:hypothetical protein
VFGRDFAVTELTTTEDLTNTLRRVIIELTKEAFWAFNCEHSDLENVVTTVLTANRVT